MEFGVWGIQNNEIGFYYTKMKREKSSQLLNALFKYIFTIFGPKMAIIISVTYSCGINCPVAKKMDFHFYHDFFQIIPHSLHQNMNFNIPGSNIYIIIGPNVLKLGFRVVWPVDRLPQLKLPSQKGNPTQPTQPSPAQPNSTTS